MQSVKYETSTLFKQTSTTNQSCAIPPVTSALKVISFSNGAKQNAGIQDTIGLASLQFSASAASVEPQPDTDCVLSPSGPTPDTEVPDDTHSPSPGTSSAAYQAETITTATKEYSPFSKHLMYLIVLKKSGNVKRNFKLSKTITGLDYRRILQERFEKKENEIKEKRRKRSTLEIKKLKDRKEEREKTEPERKAKRLHRELELEKKRQTAEKVTTQSDSDDDSATILLDICYTCYHI